MSDAAYQEHDNFEHSGNYYGIYNQFKTRPYDYQVDAIKSLKDKLLEHGFAGLFAEVGTGKTKITLDLFHIMKQYCNHMVIICPKSLISTWAKQIDIHTNIPKSKVFRWDKLYKNRNGQNTMLMLGSMSQFVFLVNVEMFQYSNALLDQVVRSLQRHPCLCVIDESVKIKEPGAKRTKQLVKYGRDFAYKVIMTGTEISAGPQSLYSQFKFLKHDFWVKVGIANYEGFKGNYCIEKQIRINGGRMVKAIKHETEMNDIERLQFNSRLRNLHNAVDPYIHRILRKDCLDLPERIEIEIPITLSDKERGHYSQMKNDCIAIIGSETFEATAVIAQFTKLRQITSGHINGLELQPMPSKLAYLMDDIESNDENAIIVCYFQKDVERVLEELLSSGYDAVSYYGANLAPLNEENKNRFENGQVRFLVAGHDMIAQGHNLQEHCALMYVYSVSLNSEVNAQYKGRIDRNGQTRRPVYKYLIAENTIDEHIHELINSKMNVQKYFSEMGRNEALGVI